MAYYIDNAIAVRILYLLVTPFEEWEAYKQGIIDASGNILKKGNEITDKDDWTMLHRLVLRLKKLLAVIPGGSSKIASYAAAYLLVKEAKNENNIEEAFLLLTECNPTYDSELLSSLSLLIEDAPVNVSGNVATIEKPLKAKRVKKHVNITKQLENIPTINSRN